MQDAIVDAHTHILPDEFRRDRSRILRQDATFRALFNDSQAKTASCAELITEMDNAKIDASVVLGYGWTEPSIAALVNDYILESAYKYSERVIPFCSVVAHEANLAVREIERCCAQGAVGVGELHLTPAHMTELEAMVPLFECLSDLQLPVVIHVSEPVGHSYPGKGQFSPQLALMLARRFPAVRFIFAHFGGGLPFYALMPEVGRELQNVWFDSAAFPFLYRTEVFLVSTMAVGCSKVMFGSDFPLTSQQRTLKEFNTANYEQELRRRILGENCRALLAA